MKNIKTCKKLKKRKNQLHFSSYASRRGECATFAYASAHIQKSTFNNRWHVRWGPGQNGKLPLKIKDVAAQIKRFPVLSSTKIKRRRRWEEPYDFPVEHPPTSDVHNQDVLSRLAISVRVANPCYNVGGCARSLRATNCTVVGCVKAPCRRALKCAGLGTVAQLQVK